MGHGKSVCDAIGGTVKRNAERAVKCGILIRNAHEFYEWAKNSNSQIDFIWCSKNDEISKVEKEIKKITQAENKSNNEETCYCAERWRTLLP